MGINPSRRYHFPTGTTVVDNFRRLGHAGNSDGSERELDDACASETNGRVVPMTKSGEIG